MFTTSANEMPALEASVLSFKNFRTLHAPLVTKIATCFGLIWQFGLVNIFHNPIPHLFLLLIL